MARTPGRGSIGVETKDLRGEHERLKGIEGLAVDEEIMDAPGAPAMFCVRDPDGNHIWVVDTP